MTKTLKSDSSGCNRPMTCWEPRKNGKCMTAMAARSSRLPAAPAAGRGEGDPAADPIPTNGAVQGALEASKISTSANSSEGAGRKDSGTSSGNSGGEERSNSNNNDADADRSP